MVFGVVEFKTLKFLEEVLGRNGLEVVRGLIREFLLVFVHDVTEFNLEFLLYVFLGLVISDKSVLGQTH